MAEKSIVLSKNATNIATQMKESGLFSDALSAAHFGMAYAIKYYWNEIGSLEQIKALDTVYDGSGNTYNIGSLDADIPMIMSSLYPGCESPYNIARILMCYGLNQISDLLEDGRLLPIYKNM